MEVRDLGFSNPEVFSGPTAGDDLPSSSSMDSFFDKIFNDSEQHTCTHTHTCNHPGPDLSHTHTCFHVHTKIVSASADETAESGEKSSSMKKWPCGNREAVRKYREKKKAHAASLEEEVAQLRAVNQQLIKKLQNQAALEAEIARFRCLLVDLRGRIEAEIGSFPYQKPIKGNGDLDSNLTQGNLPGDARALNSMVSTVMIRFPAPNLGCKGIMSDKMVHLMLKTFESVRLAICSACGVQLLDLRILAVEVGLQDLLIAHLTPQK